ncbi:MAG: T9SS type A sorting domain-containing protein [Dysgonamonadaceae bacterium]|jgi:hypothetical protein|nr:T9SS type A sorting domain-containing protein [Dysgonamonadaceae bacterium]
MEIDDESDILLYPNPFSDAIHIREGYENIEKLVITELGGRTVRILYEIKAPIIQVANLPAGIYIITIKQKQNSKNKNYKLIKK